MLSKAMINCSLCSATQKPKALYFRHGGLFITNQILRKFSVLCWTLSNCASCMSDVCVRFQALRSVLLHSNALSGIPNICRPEEQVLDNCQTTLRATSRWRDPGVQSALGSYERADRHGNHRYTLRGYGYAHVRMTGTTVIKRELVSCGDYDTWKLSEALCKRFERGTETDPVMAYRIPVRLHS